MAEYLSLVMNLVSAHTFYLGACIKMIVDNFRPSTYDYEMHAVDCW